MADNPSDELAAALQRRARSLRARAVKAQALLCERSERGQASDEAGGWITMTPVPPRWRRRDNSGARHNLAVVTKSGLGITDAVLLYLYENGPGFMDADARTAIGGNPTNLNAHARYMFRAGMVARRWEPRAIEHPMGFVRYIQRYRYRLAPAGMKRLRERLDLAFGR